jgi:hypothetical protein
METKEQEKSDNLKKFRCNFIDKDWIQFGTNEEVEAAKSNLWISDKESALKSVRESNNKKISSTREYS